MADHRPLDPTTYPAARSWVDSANVAGADFPLQNLPYGIFRRAGSDEAPRVGVAIGDAILDLAAVTEAGLLAGIPPAAAGACAAASLNALMALPRAALRALREATWQLLHEGAPGAVRERAREAVVAQDAAELFLPAQVGDYTDFYASRHHATNVGKLFRPDTPLLPNYTWVPIGYHGRASSLVVSGTPVRRPVGQRKGPDDAVPVVGPSRSLDHECELGAFVGTGNRLGEPIPIAEAEEHLFGLCLLNDWSARDIQAWEYQPLGPFLGKNFATTLSPWVVTLDALAPFRAPVAARPTGDPDPLPYLDTPADRARGGFAITVETWLRTPRMRDSGTPAVRIARGNALDLYWSFAQMLTHHAMGGCAMRPGDLLGSGTISGAAPDSRGCLLELTARGAEPLALPGGESRAFLLDGDEVILRGHAEREGAGRIGFGDCRGIVTPAPESGA